MRLIWAAIVLVACATSCGAPARAEEQLPKGFTHDLFAGENLDHFRVTSCEVAVEDGLLVLKSGNGFVRSAHRYADFVLELDWKPISDNYDSGVYFRAELPAEGKPWPSRYQVNLKKGQEGAIGGLKDAKPRPDLVKPGQWNRYRLTVAGATAALEINGQAAWKVDGLEGLHGYVGLQAEVPLGGQFQFKNIRITELAAASLFNGRDLYGWEGGSGDASACWTVEDKLLVCNGKQGPWLRSEKEYDDFNLRLEYKLKAGGNSGVYLRVPKGGQHRGKEAGEESAGVEIQILDDADPKYASLKDYQYSGSVYAIAAAKEHVCRPVGQWNTLEINCVGPRYQITHNGVLIVDAAAEEFAELGNRLTRGFLGLQNHSEEVYFRHIRLAPPLQ